MYVLTKETNRRKIQPQESKNDSTMLKKLCHLYTDEILKWMIPQKKDVNSSPGNFHIDVRVTMKFRHKKD